MNIIRIIYSNGIRMGTFQLVRDEEFEKDYFWIQVSPVLHDAPISINKSIWYAYHVGDSYRYIFNKKDLDLSEAE